MFRAWRDPSGHAHSSDTERFSASALAMYPASLAGTALERRTASVHEILHVVPPWLWAEAAASACHRSPDPARQARAQWRLQARPTRLRTLRLIGERRTWRRSSPD